jgi:multidrug efflux pump subunit AcrB
MAYDATKYIDDAINEVIKTLTETLVIVAIVIFLFLGSLRSVLVPLVAIPISLIGAVFLMQVFGFTLNLLTLLAIVLSVGLVVDDAIVIVENVERHIREGRTPRERRAAWRARTGRSGHRHDHHIGRRVCADRVSRRLDRFVVPRIRPDAGGRGVHLRHRGLDAVAGDVGIAVAPKLQQIPGIQMFPVVPPALPGGGQFPVEFVIASTADTTEILQFAQQIQERATVSGIFAFPPLIDVKIDQPQSELVFDRDKVAALGLDLQTVGSDVAAAVGGNYVNRFNIAGRSYKVIPQIKRSQRLNPDQITDLYVTGPGEQLIPLSTIATIKNSVQPRSLNRFQQLNSVKLSGVAIRPLDEALNYLEGQAASILPKGYVVDYTGESRQLRTEGDAFLPAFILAVILIFLVLAAQFNSFRDPFIILAGSVPLAMFGALMVTFLKMPNPNLPFWTDGWTTTLNVYSQVGLVTLVGLVSKNGILIVEFANVLQRQGASKLDAIKEASLTRLRPILMTTAATICGHFPLTLVSGPGAMARNSIGLVLVTGMAVGTLFTLFIVPSLYVLIARSHLKDNAPASDSPNQALASDPAAVTG